MARHHKLVTKAIENKLPKLYTFEDELDESKVPVTAKYFCPYSQATWYATEGEIREDGDILFFGLVHIQETELGYFVLSEMEEARVTLGRFEVEAVERDLRWSGTLADARREIEGRS